MTIKPDPIETATAAAARRAIETAIAEGARRALAKRAAVLRQEAAGMSTTETDSAGRPVPIVPPEARVMSRTAELLDECAAAVSTAPPTT